MRRAILTLTSVLAIVFLMQPIAQVTVVEANPFTNIGRPWSPEPGLYLTPNVGIYLEYDVENQKTQIDSFSYSLDKNANSTLDFRISEVNMTVYSRYEPERFVEGTKYTVSKTLENLANGNHTIAVYAYFSDGTVKSIMDTIFAVDTTLKPIIILISPLNQTTYNSKEVPLTYTINSKVLFSYYSIDSIKSSDLKNFNGNITLPSLSEGKHELKVHITTNISRTDMFPTIDQTIIFYVSTADPSPTPTQPTTTPITEPTQVPELQAPLAITLLVLVTSAVLVSFRKVKPKNA